MSNQPSIEMFMRWRRDLSVYEMKLTETAVPVTFSEIKAMELLKSLEGNKAEHKVLKFLFDEARKDPRGNWVSASSAPAESGQAMV
jgi:hypothetical protein